MSIRNAGFSIREARQKSGLTLEKLSEDICSVQALCRIEKGKSGVSPATFNALMGRIGIICSVNPIFQDYNDFECFLLLKLARFYCDSWQLNLAHESILKIESLSFNNNRFYYQEWLFLESKILFRTYLCEHKKLFDLLLSALKITLPHIDLNNFTNLFLSVTEISILISLAQESFYLDDDQLCISLCNQIDKNIQKSGLSTHEKDSLLSDLAICHTKYLIRKKDYIKARSIADEYRHKAVISGNEAPLLELNFLTGICSYFCHDSQLALRLFKDTFYSALAIDSNYAHVCYDYLKNHLGITLNDQYMSENKFSFDVSPKEIIDYTLLSQGIFNLDKYRSLSIGKLIQTIRINQNVSQSTLCHGLCSKSKLSKIENGTLNPDIFLTESLLQRLGLSEREFVFWGNPTENEINNIKHKLIYGVYLTEDEKENLINKLQEFDLEKNKFYKQLYFLFFAFQEKDPEIRLNILKKALDITLPSFNPSLICSYRLSWTELTILNNIAFSYKTTKTPLSGIELSRRIIDYCKMVNNNDIFEANYYPYTLYQYARTLLNQDNPKELLYLFESQDMTILKYRPNYLGGFLFYLCQAYGSSDKKSLQRYAIFSIALQNMYEHYRNPLALKEALQNDFDCVLEY